MIQNLEVSQKDLGSVTLFPKTRIFYNETQEFETSKLESMVKQPRQIHCCLLILYALLVITLAVNITLVAKNIMPAWLLGHLIGVPSLLYLLFTLCSEPHRPYARNMKDVNGMNQVYEELKLRTGHLKLTVQCFHFTGGKHRRKIVTHTALEMVPVQLCVDQSENLNALNQMDKYMFCKINKCFYFGDSNSQAMFIDIMSRFKTHNTRDAYQVWTHNLDITIPGFENEIGVCTSGSGGYLRPLFFIFTFLGLGYPYLMAVECNTARYHINCIKRLTL